MRAISEVLHLGSKTASKALILLHGRGGTAKNILTLAESLCDDDYYVSAPQAENYSWYPYTFLAENNEPYLSLSVQEIKALIDQTADKITRDKIYIMGFSQGACLSLEVTSRYAAKYGGIAAFTGGLIGSALDLTKYHGDFQGTKVFISNGDQDPHVPLLRSEQSKAVMEKLGASVTLKVYKGRPHTITQDELDWVKKHILGKSITTYPD